MSASKPTILLSLACCLVLSFSSLTVATSYSFQSNDGSSSFKNDLNDLDHNKLYVWGIDPTSTLATISTTHEKIIGASISFNNIYNWANEADILKVYLVDNPKVIDKTNNGIDVWSAADSQNTTGRLNELTDYRFTTPGNSNYRFQAILPLWTWTDVVDLQHAQTPGSTINSGHNLVYNLDQTELTTLLSYFTSPNLLATTSYNYATFGLGFDPDCHYYNDGIAFTIETAPVPEPGTMLLLGFGMFGLAIFGKRRMNKES